MEDGLERTTERVCHIQYFANQALKQQAAFGCLVLELNCLTVSGTESCAKRQLVTNNNQHDSNHFSHRGQTWKKLVDEGSSPVPPAGTSTELGATRPTRAGAPTLNFMISSRMLFNSPCSIDVIISLTQAILCTRYDAMLHIQYLQ